MAARSSRFRLAPTVRCALLMAVLMIPVVNAGTVAFANGRSVDGSATYVNSVTAADIDSDGDMDIVASRISSYLAVPVKWYENMDGKGTFAEGIPLNEDIGAATA